MHTVAAQDIPNYRFAAFTALQEAEKSYERVILPTAGEGLFENETVGLFMRHLRQVPNSRMDIKILSAIQFTADSMNNSDALVSKTLVDMGLRAPRQAFPAGFLDFIDRSFARRCWDFSDTPPSSIAALKDHWDKIGENVFAGWMGSDRRSYSYA